MNNRKTIVHCLICFVAVLAILYGAMVLSCLIPNEAIAANMKQSAYYFLEEEAYSFQKNEHCWGITDNRADQLLLNISWHMGNGDPFAAALETNYYDGEAHGLQTGLLWSVTRDVSPNTDYTRYWHGSAAFVRLFHLFTNVQGMKYLGMAAILILLVINLRLLRNRGHWELAFSLILSLLAVQIWNLRLSITYQPCFILALSLSAAAIILEKRKEFIPTVFCVLAGTATACLDFLTTETVPLLLPLLLIVAIRSKDGRLKTLGEGVKLVFPCVLAFGLSYVGAFLVKWCAVSLVAENNLFPAALSSVMERIGAEPLEGISGATPQFAAAVLANLSVLFGSTKRVDGKLVLGVLLLAAVVLLLMLKLPRKKQVNYAGIVTVLVLGSLVLLRYMVLSNHSYLHEFFTYRALCSTILAVLIVLSLRIRLPGEGSGS